MPSEHDVRQRASICQDCWFWKEMSCALASPENGVCANRRPVRGRKVQAPVPPRQASLVPLAEGHAVPMQPAAMQPAAQAPFGETAPEATFSLAQVRETTPPIPRPMRTPMADIAQRVRTAPPSFREIRAAAAASRAPIAQVTIPEVEVEGGTLTQLARREAVQASLPGMDQLVERVRQRTAQRLTRLGANANAAAHSA